MTKVFNWRQVFKVMGLLIMIECLFMIISMVVAYCYGGSDGKAFLYSVLIAFGVGLVCLLIGGRGEKKVGTREGYLIVGVVWIVFSIFGMLPFYISGAIPSLADAYFETMSGFTTTGASILNDIEALPHGLLFWRSLIQWLGGMGIVVLFIAVLPMLGSGAQLYAAEVPGPSYDRIKPRLKDTAQRLWLLYLAFTVAEAILLYAFGMGIFDAVCHSLTTMATGGYSTKQASIAHWDSPAIHYIVTFFMFLAGTNFTINYMVFVNRKFKRLKEDDEFRRYVLIIALATLFIATVLTLSHTEVISFEAIEKNFRDSLFQVVSIVTTTGYATADYMQWAPVIWVVVSLLMLVGASAGSTSGGMKIIRLNVLFKNVFHEFKRLIHPRAVVPVCVNKKVMPENFINNIHAFIVVYVACLCLGIIVLMLDGMPAMESIGASLTCISNVGPGFGEQGPAGNFAMMPDFAKWFLSFLMLIGRLELFTILLLFYPSFWKK